MKEIKNGKFKQRIFDNLNLLPEKPKQDFFNIRYNFDEFYLTGGFIRDSILQVLYDYKFPINDLDILANDDEFKYKAAKFLDSGPTRFGGMKLKYPENNFEIDVFQNPSIERFLMNCDLSTSAFVYDLRKDKLYEHNAMKDILNKEINVSNDRNFIGSTICKLILHADKMGFKIGQTGVDFIKRKYSLEIEEDILEFLKYKRISHLQSLVTSQLDFILK